MIARIMRMVMDLFVDPATPLCAGCGRPLLSGVDERVRWKEHVAAGRRKENHEFEACDGSPDHRITRFSCEFDDPEASSF